MLVTLPDGSTCRVLGELLRLRDNGDATSQESIRKGWDKMKRQRWDSRERTEEGNALRFNMTYRRVKMAFYHAFVSFRSSFVS